MAGFVEGVGEDGEDDFALGAADEIEAALLLDELELRRHSFGGRTRKADPSSRRKCRDARSG